MTIRYSQECAAEESDEALTKYLHEVSLEVEIEGDSRRKRGQKKHEHCVILE